MVSEALKAQMRETVARYPQARSAMLPCSTAMAPSELLRLRCEQDSRMVGETAANFSRGRQR